MSRWHTILRNAKVVVPAALGQTVLYFTLNHWPWKDPVCLWTMCVDGAVPFLPWTIWPYLFMISGQAVLALLVESRTIFRQTLIAYVIGMTITLGIHAFWPTFIDRPAPMNIDGFHAIVFCILYETDTPNSCFPSGHIVGPAILMWGYFRDGQKYRIGLLLLFVPLSLSILTTKQHYFWDWFGGFGVAGLAILLATKMPFKEQPRE